MDNPSDPRNQKALVMQKNPPHSPQPLSCKTPKLQPSPSLLLLVLLVLILLLLLPQVMEQVCLLLLRQLLLTEQQLLFLPRHLQLLLQEAHVLLLLLLRRHLQLVLQQMCLLILQETCSLLLCCDPGSRWPRRQLLAAHQQGTRQAHTHANPKARQHGPCSPTQREQAKHATSTCCCCCCRPPLVHCCPQEWWWRQAQGGGAKECRRGGRHHLQRCKQQDQGGKAQGPNLSCGQKRYMVAVSQARNQEAYYRHGQPRHQG